MCGSGYGYIQSRTLYTTLTFRSNHDLRQNTTSRVAKNETKQEEEEKQK